MSPLLSDVSLDELYAIRRILVGRYNSVVSVKDEFGIEYYYRKIAAMDKAIVAYIAQHNVPPEQQEQTMVEKAKAALRIPGME